MTRASIGVAATLWLTLLAADPLAATRPRLLVYASDLPRIRHACGVGDAAVHAGFGPFGAFARDYQWLRAYFARPLEGDALPGEALAAAFVHLVEPEEANAALRISLVRGALERAAPAPRDPLELIVALDWCWDALDAQTREEFTLQMRRIVQPLSAGDSPMRPDDFRNRLAGLLLAVAVDERDMPSPSWAEERARIITAARAYSRDTLPRFLEWRGLAPTAPAFAAQEERDTVLLVECLTRLLQEDWWRLTRDSLGRWMEHYALATVGAATDRQFARDRSDVAPPAPVADWEALQPLTAHLIAARVGDPAAALVAARVDRASQSAPRASSAYLWRWAPIAFDLRAAAPFDAARPPLARNLGGAIVLRDGPAPGAARVWIDAAQPYLRPGQHFDAGGFFIHAGGGLVVPGGEAINLEATPDKHGEQRLGNERDTFDFSQYATASIANNCMLFYDPARPPRWRGREYRPIGGQLPVDQPADLSTPALSAPAARGRLLAYGQTDGAAYVALDLTQACDPRSVASYTREFLWQSGGALIIIDRAEAANTRVEPAWIVNIPTRPQVDGDELSDAARVAGASDAAGIWDVSGSDWIQWGLGVRRVWLATPGAETRRRVVGGPGQTRVVEQGRHVGRAYMGGEAVGFERLILPGDQSRNPNAWFRLGAPTLLGPQVGAEPLWGRIEALPSLAQRRLTLVNLLLIREPAAPAPRYTWKDAGGGELTYRDGERETRLEISDDGPGGRVVLPTGVAWPLPRSVQPDAPLPTRRP